MTTPRGGRPKKPTALHKLQGTFDVSRHGRSRAREPITIGDLAEPPPDFTDEQQAEWNYSLAHAPRDVLRLIDRSILRAWCEESVRHKTAMAMQTARDQRRKRNKLLTAKGDRPSPYLAIMDKAALTMIRLAHELGFSPAARPGLKAELPLIEGEVDDVRANPWSALEADGRQPN